METLFRLVLTRPPIAQSEDEPSIRLSQGSEFQAALGEAHQSEGRRGALKDVARKFIATQGFVGAPDDLKIYDQLQNLSDALTVLESMNNVTNADVANAIENAFGAKPVAWSGTKPSMHQSPR